MIDHVLAKIFGTKHERELKAMRPIIAAINELEPRMQDLSKTALVHITAWQPPGPGVKVCVGVPVIVGDPVGG